MSDETVRAVAVVEVPVDVVFDVLADPAMHPRIDGTGRVRGPLDGATLRATGQIFRMAMHHEDHPDGDYQTANRVRVFERPTALSWDTGYDPGDGQLQFGGWTWRYDLAPLGLSRTRVTLSYDWSAVPDSIREYLHFPPFPPDHLEQSLARLAEAVTST